MVKEFTCIVCPNGCTITAEAEARGDGAYAVRSVQGAACPRGTAYVEQELTDAVLESLSVKLCVERGGTEHPERLHRLGMNKNHLHLIGPLAQTAVERYAVEPMAEVGLGQRTPDDRFKMHRHIENHPVQIVGIHQYQIGTPICHIFKNRNLSLSTHHFPVGTHSTAACPPRCPLATELRTGCRVPALRLLISTKRPSAAASRAQRQLRLQQKPVWNQHK